MKKIDLLHFTVANWIRANDKICVEQLISCQKCRAIACRAIAIRAVHPHSDDLQFLYFKIVESQSKKPIKSCFVTSIEKRNSKK